MARISKHHRRFREKKSEQEEKIEHKHIQLGRIDRSRYPKGIFWIIFALAGAIILTFIMRFFLIITR